ncbi:NUDIX domain-containing protein [Arthrobacter roseus]|uniref:NUDIX domain-containing protein n=1 Tax=Arthrobacter roseus TaxID=136274 RepID=UPI001964B400|nr:NUDIX hydrolase [Arthrobacter roseus]MBM7848285.1 ADP-ribose pyrophosphatase [Arthrobacter roseus]
MSLDQRLPVCDETSQRHIVESSVSFEGHIWSVVSDSFLLNAGQNPLTREYIEHPGAVAVVALNDTSEILMIRQYRHPVRMNLWEIPAGLLDVDGEDYQSAAARELAEEADLTAGRWNVLTDMFNSPGSSNEAIRIYLARGITEVPKAERHTRTGEESEIEVLWVPLNDAVAGVLAGRIHNATAVAGILAAAAASGTDFAALRGAEALWPEHRS